MPGRGRLKARVDAPRPDSPVLKGERSHDPRTKALQGFPTCTRVARSFKGVREGKPGGGETGVRVPSVVLVGAMPGRGLGKACLVVTVKLPVWPAGSGAPKAGDEPPCQQRRKSWKDGRGKEGGASGCRNAHLAPAPTRVGLRVYCGNGAPRKNKGRRTLLPGCDRDTRCAPTMDMRWAGGVLRRLAPGRSTPTRDDRQYQSYKKDLLMRAGIGLLEAPCPQ